MAITLAITPVISRCVGAGDYEQAKYYNKKLMLITYVSMTAMVLFIFSLLPVILKAYNLSNLTARTTADIIHFHGIGAIFIWPIAFSPCGGRCESVYVYFKYIHVDIPDRIQLRAWEISGHGCIWCLGCDGH